MNGLGADEMLFQVGVDGAGRRLRTRVPRHRPGPTLVLTDREERNHTQQLVGFADQPRQPAFLQTVTREELLSFFVAHVGKLGFTFSADGCRAGILTLAYPPPPSPPTTFLPIVPLPPPPFHV